MTSVSIRLIMFSARLMARSNASVSYKARNAWFSWWALSIFPPENVVKYCGDCRHYWSHHQIPSTSKKKPLSLFCSTLMAASVISTMDGSVVVLLWRRCWSYSKWLWLKLPNRYLTVFLFTCANSCLVCTSLNWVSVRFRLLLLSLHWSNRFRPSFRSPKGGDWKYLVPPSKDGSV